MSHVNKYGLSREIPEPTKLKIRQHCGFGCIFCGNALYQYEHVDPPFSEAKEHDPDHIVLLCGGCHDRVTRGLLSKESVKRMSLNPKCNEQGFSFGPFEIGTTPPEVIIGNFKCKNVATLISIDGDAVLSVKPPTEPGHPFLINAFLCDKDGREILRIVDNEWRTPSSNWDTKINGSRLTIRGALREVLLVLKSEPPHRLIFETVNMKHKGIEIVCKNNRAIQVTTSTSRFVSKGMSAKDCKIGIYVTHKEMLLGIGCGSLFIDHLELSHSPNKS